MDAVLITNIIILVFLIVIGMNFTKYTRSREEHNKKYRQYFYTEIRRASRLSLECKIELDNMNSSNRRMFEKSYRKQEQILQILNQLAKTESEYDLSQVVNKDDDASDILQQVMARQEYITNTIEKLGKNINKDKENDDTPK